MGHRKYAFGGDVQRTRQDMGDSHVREFVTTMYLLQTHIANIPRCARTGVFTLCYNWVTGRDTVGGGSENTVGGTLREFVATIPFFFDKYFVTMRCDT